MENQNNVNKFFYLFLIQSLMDGIIPVGVASNTDEEAIAMIKLSYPNASYFKMYQKFESEKFIEQMKLPSRINKIEFIASEQQAGEDKIDSEEAMVAFLRDKGYKITKK